jgi:hypothetical protein
MQSSRGQREPLAVCWPVRHQEQQVLLRGEVKVSVVIPIYPSIYLRVTTYIFIYLYIYLLIQPMTQHLLLALDRKLYVQR